jgi:hypothetical protein
MTTGFPEKQAIKKDKNQGSRQDGYFQDIRS